MTKVQKIQYRLSECRQKLNELLGIETRTDAQQAELETLTAEVAKLEPEYRAALAAEPPAEPVRTGDTPPADPEIRERMRLKRESTLGGFLLAHMQGREPTGPEAEYRSALGITAGIPTDLFEPDAEARAVAPPETRADVATTVPATGTGATLAPIQPAIFAPSIAARLGIDMPTVGSGSFTEATISASLSAAAKAKGATQESTAATITPATASPRRISARLTLQIEDTAAIGQGNYESALRQNLSMALSDRYDIQAITGDGTAPNVTGLIKQLTDPTDPTDVATWDSFLQSLTDQVDGLWATMLSHVALLVNPDTYRLAARTFRDKVIDEGTGAGVRAAASLGDVSFADYAMAKAGGFSTNKRMPATNNNIAQAVVHRTGQPGIRTACHPVWNAITVDDIYSDAASGQRHVTMHVLVGDKVLLVQPDAYRRLDYKVS